MIGMGRDRHIVSKIHGVPKGRKNIWPESMISPKQKKKNPRKIREEMDED